MTHTKEEIAADEYVEKFRNTPKDRRIAFLAGVDWQKQQSKDDTLSALKLFRDHWCQNIDLSTLEEWFNENYPNNAPTQS